MSAILAIVLPVFLVTGFGYLARWRRLISDEQIDGLMVFTQGFAIPCLLFRAISTLDLGASVDAPLLASYYSAMVICFTLGLLGARHLFGRNWQDSVAIGFCALFSNTLLLGLPITERAYGTEGLAGNYAIIAFHAPFGYALGITAMELARAQGTPLRHIPGSVARAMGRNPLVIGVGLGFVVNLTALPLPVVLTEAIDLMIRAALPAALFGLGGVLYRYRPEGDLRTILFVCALSLALHPALVWMIGTSLDLSQDGFRSAVVTASVAPGVNAYVFANLYGCAKRVAASSVLIGTGMSVVTTSIWLGLLP